MVNAMPGDEYEVRESFRVGDLSELEAKPDRDLTLAMGDRAEGQGFTFYEAPILRDSDGASTSSYIELAHSKQMGGSYVVWFSGVSALEAARSCSYGWIDCLALGNDFRDTLFKRSLVQGEPITGHYRNIEDYYANRLR